MRDPTVHPNKHLVRHTPRLRLAVQREVDPGVTVLPWQAPRRRVDEARCASPVRIRAAFSRSGKDRPGVAWPGIPWRGGPMVVSVVRLRGGPSMQGGSGPGGARSGLARQGKAAHGGVMVFARGSTPRGSDSRRDWASEGRAWRGADWVGNARTWQADDGRITGSTPVSLFRGLDGQGRARPGRAVLGDAMQGLGRGKESDGRTRGSTPRGSFRGNPRRGNARLGGGRLRAAGPGMATRARAVVFDWGPIFLVSFQSLGGARWGKVRRGLAPRGMGRVGDGPPF